ncbi:trimethylamine-corrinoid protein Co-methyltransferase [Acididesulfobacillus acetoxydans]|uniref:Trimethylamine methyltransferase MttB1 n=1 Tax=Acididesulfobacillus acetoxydans TaxID=1561005 RepID=A0A8S0XVS4_9FIRM|nr:trimethylamine methyltransferase family protein [Acididesulfobacillus acetoxydans]CAA7600557.1 trimethylamine-corrinoid protein Co-methyltransferase [Acididesulfobacillus acetoxydans]CEJ06691.1 Trimethylamine methyltransferase MttB1 [Acididesulfobacillus acetoxydans]
MNSWLEVLKPEEIEEIHAASLEVLEDVGVEFQLEEARAAFQAHGARVAGSRVYIPRLLIEQALTAAPERFLLEARNPARSVWIGGGETVFAPPAGCVYVQATGTARRSAVPADYIDLVRLVHQSTHYGTNGGGIVIPEGDFGSDEEKFAWLLLAGHWYSDKPQMGLNLGAKVSRLALDFSRMAFGGRPGCRILGTINPDSPLMFSPEMLASLLIYAREGQGLIVAPCSMAIATSPATLAGTLVVNNAEILAGLTLAQLVRPGTPVVYGNTSTIADMKTMAIALGAPELSLLVLGTAQMARRYRLPSRAGGSLTDAKEPDMQAGLESMLSLLSTVAGGVSIVMHAGGILDSFLTLSYEKLIIDEDTGGMAKRFQRGIEVNRETLALEAIADRGAGGNFLDHEHTLKHFRNEIWRPQLSDREVYQEGRDYQAYTLAKATQAWQKRLEGYSRPVLPEEVEREMLDFYHQRFGSEPVLDV